MIATNNRSKQRNNRLREKYNGCRECAHYSLDSNDVLSYRPISNLSEISKLLERIDNRQVTEFLTRADLLP